MRYFTKFWKKESFGALLNHDYTCFYNSKKFGPLKMMSSKDDILYEIITAQWGNLWILINELLIEVISHGAWIDVRDLNNEYIRIIYKKYVKYMRMILECSDHIDIFREEENWI